MSHPYSSGLQQRGAALVMVLVLSLVMTSAGLLALAAARTELKIAHNDVAARQALALAEAGLHHAHALITADAADGLSDEFGEAVDGGLARLGDRVALVEDGSERVYRCRGFGISAADRYCVRARDNYDETAGADDPAVDRDGVITLSVQARRGTATRRLEARVGLSQGPDCAILTQGPLQVGGSPGVTGRRGCVHSNRDVRINGHPELERGGFASGEMEVVGSPLLEGRRLNSSDLRDAYEASHRGQPRLFIPSVRPMRFGRSGIELWREIAADADGYRLDGDGSVYVGPGHAGAGGPGGDWSCDEAAADCSGGRVIGDGRGPGWNGWRFQGGRWTVHGAGTPEEGLYFVEGSVRIGAGPGTAADPWNVTLVATNSIAITGHPIMAPFAAAGGSRLRNVLFVSGNDLELAGTPDNVYSGGLFAHQQIKLGGNPRIEGFIIAEDGATTWPGDPAPQCESADNLICNRADGNAVMGDPEVTYNGLSTALYEDRLQRLGWNDVR